MRLSGPEAINIAMPMLRLNHALEHGRAIFGELVEPSGAEAHVRRKPGTITTSVATAAPDLRPRKVGPLLMTTNHTATRGRGRPRHTEPSSESMKL